MSIRDVEQALKNVVENVYHYRAPGGKPQNYIVWGEVGPGDSMYADDESEEIVIRGELWYYTSKEFDTKVNEIMSALSDADISYKITAIGYDEQLSQIVYGFDWSVCCGQSGIY